MMFVKPPPSSSLPLVHTVNLKSSPADPETGMVWERSLLSSSPMNLKEQSPAALWLQTRLSPGASRNPAQLFGMPSPLLSFSNDPFFTRLAARALPATTASAMATSNRAAKTRWLVCGVCFRGVINLGALMFSSFLKVLASLWHCNQLHFIRPHFSATWLYKLQAYGYIIIVFVRLPVHLA